MADADLREEEGKELNREMPISDLDEPQKTGSGGGGISAAGTPGGGTSFGGLAGTNIGDGDPENADLEDALGDGTWDDEGGKESEAGAPYAGHSGGAVGGTPAEDRAAGGNIHGGLAPGGVHRGDSTIGSNPPPGHGMSKEEAEAAEKRARQAGGAGRKKGGRKP